MQPKSAVEAFDKHHPDKTTVLSCIVPLNILMQYWDSSSDQNYTA